MVRRVLAAALAAGFLFGAAPDAHAVSGLSARPEERRAAREPVDPFQALWTLAPQLDDSGLQLVEDAVGSASAEYAYSDLYDVQAAYDRYLQAPVVQTRPTDIIRDGRLDPQTLFDTVRANNADYLTAGAGAGQTYMEPSDQALMDYCRIISATVEHELAQGGLTTNYDDVTYNLSHLTIFLAHTSDNAAVTEDGRMIVSPVNLEDMKTISGNPDADKITIAHEAEHLLQKISVPAQQAEGASRGYGYCLYFDALPVNSLFHKWLFEAAAENLACACYDSEPITYLLRVSYLNSLTLALLPNADFAVYDVERLTQQQELDRVFETFGCRTEGERTELLNLLEAINIILEDDEDFWTRYQPDVNSRQAGEAKRAELKTALQNGVCTTLAKLFYRSLADCLHRAPAALSDIFALISVFEADLNGHISYSGRDDPSGIRHFLDNYRLIQNGFFAALAQALGVTPDTLRGAYEAYNGAADIPASLACLDDGKNAFLARLVRDTAGQRSVSIQTAAEACGAVSP